MFGLFLTLLLLTGQRQGTMREVKFENFSFENNEWVLRLYSSKSKAAAAYFIPEYIGKAVLHIKSNREEIFKKRRANLLKELKSNHSN
jgi:hypothetical protein